jgi:hypothetical protein
MLGPILAGGAVVAAFALGFRVLAKVGHLIGEGAVDPCGGQTKNEVLPDGEGDYIRVINR